jgi:predicted HAD superfamily phosphohydrolase
VVSWLTSPKSYQSASVLNVLTLKVNRKKAGTELTINGKLYFLPLVEAAVISPRVVPMDSN